MILSEKSYLEAFLNKSVELEKMRKLSVSGKISKHLMEIMDKIDKAESFSTLLHALDKLDLYHCKDDMVKKLGISGMQSIFYFSGFVSNNASFCYHGSHLAKFVNKQMLELGYQYQKPVVERLEPTSHQF